jgi:hypothetical protein
MGKRKDFPSAHGDGVELRADRVQQAIRKLQAGFYSGERGDEMIANSLVALVMDEFYTDV